MKLKKLVALVLTFGVTLGLTGCIGNFYPSAITVDGAELSSGLYLMMQYTAYNEAEDEIELPETEEDEAEEDASEPEIDVLKQTIDGQSAKDWIAQRTEELCRRYVLVERLCFEKGITLNEEGQSYLEQSMSYWEYLADHYEENGITAETFQRYLVNESLGDQLFQEMYGEEGELAPSDDEMKEEYSAKNAHVRFLSVPLTASDDESTDKSEEIAPLMEAILEELRGGKTLEEVAQEDLGPVYELLGREYNAETLAESVSDSYISYEQPDGDDTYSPEFLEELKGQEVGEFGSYNMSTTVLLYEVIPTFETEEAFTEMRSTIVGNLYQEDFDEYLAGMYNEFAVSRPFGSQWYFRPSKIVA